ncbi:CCA tRNA nucleotidyltransferase [Bdellovibrio bacteriovorus]|uniref:CCA tRNA nucleotidyltransferase n=1 Tax=Bdellovibrio bacteriovorus TaxID=959 RepID=UPI0021D37328|nr:CCA tRNA nucleotidyltransferase [Bdellovibrio bacteriovorus]UXR63689.1 CCA tRNA nucleotidyltransferase [Bdellovibrio bacteriovorus]
MQKLIHSHPHWSAVESIYHTLQAHGYKAFLAGGCVRDALLGLQANDLDVATDANPDQIESLFKKTVNVGKSFGVMRVLVDGADIEVATFRNDGAYLDGRRPESVIFSTPEEDAQRRDFTVNALMYDLATEEVLDYVGGQADLQAGILRTVGDAERRFLEDHLRLLRAARFSAQLNFVIEEKSFQAMTRMASLVSKVSGERIRDEMNKLLKTSAVLRGLQAMADAGLMKELFPFRLRDNSWQQNNLASQFWQALALFVRQADSVEMEKALDLLKLSSRERRCIEDSWAVWQDARALLELNMGKKLQKMARDGVAFALRILLEEDSEKLQIQELFTQWNSWQCELPRPFLTGEDVKGTLTGKAIGNCLEQAYELQLERSLHSRDEALQWLQTYLKKES